MTEQDKTEMTPTEEKIAKFFKINPWAAAIIAFVLIGLGGLIVSVLNNAQRKIDNGDQAYRITQVLKPKVDCVYILVDQVNKKLTKKITQDSLNSIMQSWQMDTLIYFMKCRYSATSRSGTNGNAVTQTLMQ